VLTDEDIITRVIDDEGRALTDRADDPGGITNFGITIPAFTDYLRAATGNHGAVATPEDIRALTEANARDYYRWLLKSTGIGRIQNVDVRYFVFDAAVNLGPTQAVRLLQRALGVADDGKIGPVTLTAVPLLDARRLNLRVGIEQMQFYGRLAAKNLADRDRDGVPDNLEFLPGWLNRLGRKLMGVLA
jgi:lysozyme family protein